VYRRKKLVAAVVSPDLAKEIAASQRKSDLAEAFAELRRICAEEGYALPVPRRRDRAASPSSRRR